MENKDYHQNCIKDMLARGNSIFINLHLGGRSFVSVNKTTLKEESLIFYTDLGMTNEMDEEIKKRPNLKIEYRSLCIKP